MGTGAVEEWDPVQVVGRHSGGARHPLEGPVAVAPHGAHPGLLAGVDEAAINPAGHTVHLEHEDQRSKQGAFL